jgi:hypothetical protein
MRCWTVTDVSLEVFGHRSYPTVSTRTHGRISSSFDKRCSCVCLLTVVTDRSLVVAFEEGGTGRLLGCVMDG